MSQQPSSAHGNTNRPPPRLRQADRSQLLLPMPLDDLLDDDHQARVVWDFCLGVDLSGVAKAAGFRACGTVYGAAQLKTWIPRLYRQAGPLFVNIKVTTEPAPLVLPVRDGPTLRNRFREALLGAKAHE